MRTSYKEDQDPRNNGMHKEFFLKGLTAAIRNRVQTLLPSTFSESIAKALEAEQEIATREPGKTSKPNDYLNHVINTNDERTPSEPPQRKNTVLMKSMKEMQGTLSALTQLMQQNKQPMTVLSAESTPSSSGARYNWSTWKASTNQAVKYDPTTRPPMRCFHCGELGHTFRRCRSSTAEQRESIQNNLPRYIEQARARTTNGRATSSQQTNSLNSKQTPTAPSSSSQ